jgi:hypothetical protein
MFICKNSLHGSLLLFKLKHFLLLCINTLIYHNASVAVVNAAVIEQAPGNCTTCSPRVTPVVYFFVANTFQIQPFHKGLAKRADVAFCFMPGS